MTRFETQIAIAADSIEALRRCDVMRVLDTYDGDAHLAEWIRDCRPDLSDEIDDCLDEIETNGSP